MAIFETLLALLAFGVVLALVASRLQVPVAVPLVLGGMALALVPGLPPVELDPELALALFLPPLLQLSAYRTDWPAFRTHLRPILLMALGAVAFSALAVAVVAKLMVPALPWWAAVALGAIVAPPDAVAAASVLRRFRLPKRIVVVLEGESLINDASSLVLYRFAVAAVAAGTASYGRGALEFLGMAAGGAAVGWLVGRLAMRVFACIEDTLLDITVSLLAGFAAYLAAEALHVSGVLAAVGCGMVLGRQQHAEFTARTRLELNAVWNFVEFVLASLVFLLIGLQLRGIVERLADYDGSQLAWLGAAVSATLMASRFAWVYPMTWLAWERTRGRPGAPARPPWGQATVLSWAGMRGVVSLAAALALPAQFPGRDIIVFLAFCSILATLVVQGTTLGWVVRSLDVAEPDEGAAAPGRLRARMRIVAAALRALRAQRDRSRGRPEQAVAAELVEEYELLAVRVGSRGDAADGGDARIAAQLRLRLVAIDAARRKLAEQAGRLDADSQRTLGEELDLEEQRIRRALEEA